MPKKLLEALRHPGPLTPQLKGPSDYQRSAQLVEIARLAAYAAWAKTTGPPPGGSPKSKSKAACGPCSMPRSANRRTIPLARLTEVWAAYCEFRRGQIAPSTYRRDYNKFTQFWGWPKTGLKRPTGTRAKPLKPRYQGVNRGVALYHP